MKVFGLVAHGPLKVFNGGGQVMSRYAYLTREAAEAAILAFKERVMTGPASLSDLESIDRVQIIELEVVDG